MHDFWPLIFWILMVLWIVFGVVPGWPTTGTPGGWRPFANSVLLWFLLALLGAYAIGAPGLPGR